MNRTVCLVGSLLFAACSLDATPAPTDAATATDAATTDAAAAVGRCAARLVRLSTGNSPECSGGNEHLWPVGMAASDCHGWRSLDTTGREHENSANHIVCNADGSFSFTQFAGNLDCTGTGTVKTYRLDGCEQDIPPTLYTVATDLTCCSEPSSAACVTGNPSVTVAGSTIFLNGTICTN